MKKYGSGGRMLLKNNTMANVSLVIFVIVMVAIVYAVLKSMF
jgi:hypothetical protein